PPGRLCAEAGLAKHRATSAITIGFTKIASSIVTAGLPPAPTAFGRRRLVQTGVPAIHVSFTVNKKMKTWMPRTRAGHDEEGTDRGRTRAAPIRPCPAAQPR